MSETEVKAKPKTAKKAEAKYPEGIEAKIDNMTNKDMEVVIKALCLNSGQNQILTSMGFRPLTVQDMGKLARKS